MNSFKAILLVIGFVEIQCLSIIRLYDDKATTNNTVFSSEVSEDLTTTDHEGHKSCVNYLQEEGWIPLSNVLEEDVDLFMLGKDHNGKLFACRVEYNGKIYFGKGSIEERELMRSAGVTTMGHGDFEDHEEDATNPPEMNNNEILKQPNCWVADGKFESVFRSGFSVLKNPPTEKFSLKWQTFEQENREVDWAYLLSKGAVNVDSKGNNGFVGRCKHENLYELKSPHFGTTKSRKRRFIAREEFEKATSYVGYINPHKSNELLVPYDSIVGACDNFEFLTCSSKN